VQTDFHAGRSVEQFRRNYADFVRAGLSLIIGFIQLPAARKSGCIEREAAVESKLARGKQLAACGCLQANSGRFTYGICAVLRKCNLIIYPRFFGSFAVEDNRHCV